MNADLAQTQAATSAPWFSLVLTISAPKVKMSNHNKAYHNTHIMSSYYTFCFCVLIICMCSAWSTVRLLSQPGISVGFTWLTKGLIQRKSFHVALSLLLFFVVCGVSSMATSGNVGVLTICQVRGGSFCRELAISLILLWCHRGVSAGLVVWLRVGGIGKDQAGQDFISTTLKKKKKEKKDLDLPSFVHLISGLYSPRV